MSNILPLTSPFSFLLLSFVDNVLLHLIAVVAVQSTLMCTVVTFAVCMCCNSTMRKSWVLMNSLKRSDKSHLSLIKNTITTSFIIDSKMQFVFSTAKGEDFIKLYELHSNSNVTNFTQLLKRKDYILLIKDNVTISPFYNQLTYSPPCFRQTKCQDRIRKCRWKCGWMISKRIRIL